MQTKTTKQNKLLRPIRWILSLYLLFAASSTMAQNIVVSGTVFSDSLAAEGVTVALKRNAAHATRTDAKGAYSIAALPTDILVFTSIGFETKEVNVDGKTSINVYLDKKQDELDDVVIVGFGDRQKRTSMVSAINSIDPKELQGPTSNLTTMMAGRVGGMIAYQRSGEPGSDNASFFIRGLGTFGSGKQDPLILIDGIESTNTDMARLQPDDIASFSVLRDASASAVYGARGANGVVLITTKSGVAGKTKFKLRSEATMSSNTRNFQFADNIKYMQLANEASLTRNPNAAIPYDQSKIDGTLAGRDPLLYPNNNWIDLLVKDYTINTRNNISVEGGGEKAVYYISGTYNIDNGVLNVEGLNNFNNNIKLKNYNVRSNVDLNLTNTTKAGIKVYAQFDDYSGPLLGANGEGGGTRIFNQAIWANPVMFPAVYPNEMSPFTTHPLFGNAITPFNGLYVNPYAEMVKGYSEFNTSTVQAQIELKQDLKSIIPGLSTRLMSYVRRYSYFDYSRLYEPFYYNASNITGQTELTLLNGGGVGSIGTTGREYLDYREGRKNLDATFYGEWAFNYNRTFNEKHAVGGMLITTMRNFLAGNAGSLQLSLPARNQGLAGRFTYGYDGRYMAEFNFGYNGSERFANNNRVGFFPTFGLGYLVSNEKFFEPLLHIVDELKLRGTYGFVGSDQIGSASDRFFYLSEVNMANGTYGATFGELYGRYRDGISVSRYANPNITWERSEQINIGLDLRLFKSLGINIDVYQNNRSNILSARTYIPATMGLQAGIIANTNQGKSRGVDIMTNYNKQISRDFSVQLRGNFTYAASKIIKYDEPSYPENEYYRSRVGVSMAQRYGYIAERLFVDDKEAQNSPLQFDGIPGINYGGGDIKYRDVNGDGVIDNRDMVPIGLPTTPEIIYGFGGTFMYKSFDLSLFFQGSARSSFFINSENISPFVLNGGSQNGLLKMVAESYWSEENRDIYAIWPRLSPNFVYNNSREASGETSTWWMRRGDFLRLKQVEIGFNANEYVTRKLGMKSLRIYVNSTNLGVQSSFTYWDPEMGGNGLGYPVQRTYNLGIHTTF